MDDDSHDDARDGIDAADEVFVRAPASDNPASSQQVDAVPYRATVHAWAEDLRAEAGLRPLSADSFRRQRALKDRNKALEFAERRKVAVGLEEEEEEEDKLFRSVQAAMDTQVVGSCAYCGCNFSVKAAEDVGGLGLVCSACGRRLRVYSPVPLVRNPPANAEERWKGWLPW